jgi:septal ring factor EnvC (AmiA/AmiB activator)
MKLSKRANIDSSVASRVTDLVKQLKFNHVLHDNHKLKVQPEKKQRTLNRAKRILEKLEQQIGELKDKNKKIRKQLKENDADKKELSYYIRELKEALDFARGQHPIQEALRSIKEENENIG